MADVRSEIVDKISDAVKLMETSFGILVDIVDSNFWLTLNEYNKKNALGKLGPRGNLGADGPRGIMAGENSYPDLDKTKYTFTLTCVSKFAPSTVPEFVTTHGPRENFLVPCVTVPTFNKVYENKNVVLIPKQEAIQAIEILKKLNPSVDTDKLVTSEGMFDSYVVPWGITSEDYITKLGLSGRYPISRVEASVIGETKTTRITLRFLVCDLEKNFDSIIEFLKSIDGLHK